MPRRRPKKDDEVTELKNNSDSKTVVTEHHVAIEFHQRGAQDISEEMIRKLTPKARKNLGFIPYA